MQKKGMLFVISGPAGAGKSEIVKTVLKKHPDVRLSVSCTTRKPREGEVNGVHYHFKTMEEFKELVAQNAFYEHAEVHGNCYGTLKSVVREQLEAGNNLILEIDVQGCAQVLEQDKDAVGIFICPPSRENLEKRLVGRGTETEESLRIRLGNVAGEVDRAYDYPYIIIHRDWSEVPNALEIAADEVYAIMTAKQRELNNNREFLDALRDSLRA